MFSSGTLFPAGVSVCQWTGMYVTVARCTRAELVASRSAAVASSPLVFRSGTGPPYLGLGRGKFFPRPRPSVGSELPNRLDLHLELLGVVLSEVFIQGREETALDSRFHFLVCHV